MLKFLKILFTHEPIKPTTLNCANCAEYTTPMSDQMTAGIHDCSSNCSQRQYLEDERDWYLSHEGLIGFRQLIQERGYYNDPSEKDDPKMQERIRHIDPYWHQQVNYHKLESKDPPWLFIN